MGKLVAIGLIEYGWKPSELLDVSIEELTLISVIFEEKHKNDKTHMQRIKAKNKKR